MKKTAIIIGATGLTGGHLLDLLLEDDSYGKVIVPTRRSTGKTHPKLEEHIIDLMELENHADLLKGDVVFCCVGTTNAKTPDNKEYHRIDFGIPVNVAKLAIQNKVKQLQIISAPGANSKSRVFYTRTKGEMQDEVIRIAKDQLDLYFLQPSLIVGVREDKRGKEGFANAFMSVFNFMIPLNYKKIRGLTVAKAMQKIAEDGFSSIIISSAEIQKLGR